MILCLIIVFFVMMPMMRRHTPWGQWDERDIAASMKRPGIATLNRRALAAALAMPVLASEAQN